MVVGVVLKGNYESTRAQLPPHFAFRVLFDAKKNGFPNWMIKYVVQFRLSIFRHDYCRAKMFSVTFYISIF